MRSLAHALDPRRSLVAALTWLVVALAGSFAVGASLWVGGVAREIVVQQHARRLVLEADQLAADVAQAAISRLGAVHAAEQAVPFEQALDYLIRSYPTHDWLAAVTEGGSVVAGKVSLAPGANLASIGALDPAAGGFWIGQIEDRSQDSPGMHALGEIAVPFKDSAGRTAGFLIARLSRRWGPGSPPGGADRPALDFGSAPTVWIVDSRGTVRVGVRALTNRPWSGQIQADPPPLEMGAPESASPGDVLRYERLADGATVLVAAAPVTLGPTGRPPDWQVMLSEPRTQVYQRADALAARILWISLCLGVLTALAGALGARHLTNRLRRLTRSAAAIGRSDSGRIEVPAGRDEVTQLAAVLSKVLDDLHRERSELRAASGELERRVALRSPEVERLAEEARYAAIVRERLKISRDLHDTLAHSMMAMLSEIRLLRKLHSHDPASLNAELARAEEVARDGLTEARTAIAQMRVNAVRDTGLGPALARLFERFVDRTALEGEFFADPQAASFGDERAETLYRMAEEALRNVERHAGAARVELALQVVDGTHVRMLIRDDGVGFDPLAAHPGHFGLVGLREQAALIGADLAIDSAPRRGTVLEVSLRMAPELL